MAIERSVQFADYSFEHWNDDPGEGHTTITAETKDGDPVGVLALDPQGYVSKVEVEPAHQRRGVATGMWNHAKALGLGPRHDILQSAEGRAWASKVGY